MISILLFGCAEKKEERIMDFSDLDSQQREKLIARVQEEVNNKRPFQGSIIHQRRCDTLIALGHNISGALQEKSTPHTKIGDYHLAFPLLEEAASINPEESLYYYSWLLLYYYRDYDRALDRLTQYDDFTPNTTDYAWGENVNYLKGLALKQLGRYNKAIKEFTFVITDESTTDPYLYLYRGISYLKNGNNDLAIKDFDTAIQLYDKCSAAYFWKAEALRKIYPEESIKNYKLCKKLLTQGYFKTDPYVSLFDIPVLEQVDDRLEGVRR
jgi:tetratricopeptide (TPR) repeat protein